MTNSQHYITGHFSIAELIESIKEMAVREYLAELNDVTYSVKPDITTNGSCLCLAANP